MVLYHHQIRGYFYDTILQCNLALWCGVSKSLPSIQGQSIKKSFVPDPPCRMFQNLYKYTCISLHAVLLNSSALNAFSQHLATRKSALTSQWLTELFSGRARVLCCFQPFLRSSMTSNLLSLFLLLPGNAASQMCTRVFSPAICMSALFGISFTLATVPIRFVSSCTNLCS